jgi:hypothetical protein
MGHGRSDDRGRHQPNSNTIAPDDTVACVAERLSNSKRADPCK